MNEFQVDLSNCDREPIHIPGKVQSHGFLLSYRADNRQIEYASSNMELFTGINPRVALSHTIDDFWARQSHIDISLPELKTLLAELEAGQKQEVAVAVKASGQTLTLIAHKNNGHIVLEFEPQLGDVSNLKLNDTIGELLAPIQDGISLSQLFGKLAWHIKDIIKYDRVMVYKYWDDWHGEVVAEEKREDLEPFLGLHYPASDVPRQARELYLLNLVRIIADVDAEPAILLSSHTQPLDLTHSSLRAVSPMHIQYLQNMGVKASFSISLVHHGKLWGLIACHNYTPRFIDHESRQACKLLAQLLSTMLNTKLEEEQAVTSNKFKDEADHIFKTLYRTGKIATSLINNGRSVLKIGSATGAALVFNDKVYTIGSTPTETEIISIVKWLQSNAPTPLYHTNHLPKFFTKAVGFSKVASGLMAAELFKNNGEYVLWFKPELSQTVKWAGNPQKPIEVDATGATRLTPRQSFAVWYEEVKNSSENWGHAEILAALRMREGILQVISQKADETRKLNEKLKEAYDELDTFSYTISHDLRTPLSVIKNYAEILVEELPNSSQEDILEMLNRIIKGADTMDALIKSVLAYSRLSALDASGSQTIDMLSLMHDIVEMTLGKERGKQQVIIKECPTIVAPKVIVQQIFCNLVENGIKYSSTQEAPMVVIEGEHFENEIIYTIADNGIGIDATQGDKVFLPFQRLDNATGFDGTGIGLATVKRLVKKLGGRIWFESKLNQGATFFVSFPELSKRP